MGCITLISIIHSTNPNFLKSYKHLYETNYEKFLQKICNNKTQFKCYSKDLLYSLFHHLYNRLLGIMLYDILKDKNVKTVPKAIVNKYNLLKQYASNDNDINKLTVYYKTAKKCIEYGLPLPFSAKYKFNYNTSSSDAAADCKVSGAR